MTYYVYCLTSRNQTYLYVGLTKDVDNRLNRHNSGREKTTRSYRPFDLIFLTTAESRQEARMIEKYLKSGIGKELLKRIAT